MVKKIGAIIGIDKQNNKSIYRALLIAYDKNNTGEIKWQFQPRVLSDEQIIESFRAGLEFINIELINGKVHGSAGDLKRFENKNGSRPIVIIAQTSNSDGRAIGYIVANYDGKVTRVSTKQLLAYGNTSVKKGCTPVQNAIFIAEDNNKASHFKSYPNKQFIEEIIVVNKNEHNDTRRVNTANNQKTLTKAEQIYTPEQIKQLKLGKQKGIDIRIYANPKLSAEQMKILRKGIESKINVRPFAFPDYSVEAMKFYIVEIACKMDIRSFLSPKYSLEQLGELSLAAEDGLDISKLSDPSLSAKKMEEIRERLKAGVFREMEVDGKMQMVI